MCEEIIEGWNNPNDNKTMIQLSQREINEGNANICNLVPFGLLAKYEWQKKIDLACNWSQWKEQKNNNDNNNNPYIWEVLS